MSFRNFSHIKLCHSNATNVTGLLKMLLLLLACCITVYVANASYLFCGMPTLVHQQGLHKIVDSGLCDAQTHASRLCRICTAGGFSFMGVFFVMNMMIIARF